MKFARSIFLIWFAIAALAPAASLVAQNTAPTVPTTPATPAAPADAVVPVEPAAPWYVEMAVLGNELWRVAALCLTILTLLILGRLLRHLFSTGAESMEKRNRPFSAVTLRSLSRASAPALAAVGIKLGLAFLVLNAVVDSIAATVTSILMTMAIAYVAYCLVDVVEVWLRRMAGRTESKLDDMLVPMVRASLRVTIVVLLLVQVATILSDKPVTSIIAGLGVGGLAIGLAAQDTIKNFFGSLMIFSDRPFELGDRIVVDGHDGPVESVGFRSTRIRTLDGHLVTIPNGELANKTILNIGKRPSIRRVMNVTVTYDTPPDKVQRAIDILKEILQDHEGMRADFPPRVLFNDFNAASLNIYAVYWYFPADWWKYSDFNQRVNFEILTRFNNEGIEFAFPTQTLYLAGDPNRPLDIGRDGNPQRPSPSAHGCE
jgi:MscS family membrane protein